MKFFIPPLGTKFRLNQHWSFKLMCERRNKTLWDLVSVVQMDNILYRVRRNQFVDVTLTDGAILTVDRIYVRAGADAYNSVTFRAEVNIDGVLRKVRFWVPLSEVNGINMKRIM